MTDFNRRDFVLSAAGAVVAGSLMATTARAADANSAVRVGCIGVGNRGSALLKAILGTPNVTVRAICDILPAHLECAEKSVTDAGQPKPEGFADWKKLLESKEIDVVFSALPCDLHAACYLDVIAAGKDLYGEKPMCLTVADCDQVVAATKASKQIVQIGFQRRADPRFIETIKQVHDGEIGDLLEGRILWSNSWGPLYDWFGKRERSGDWMVEQAVHNWDVMNWANNCLPVRAMGLGRDDLYREKQPDRNVHDYYTAVVQYENGAIVNIIHSWVAPGKFNEEFTRLTGTKGGVDFNSGTFSYRPDLKKPDRVGFTAQGNLDNTKLSVESFINSVRSRQPAVASVEHGRNAVITCLMVRQAVYSKGVATRADVGA